MEPMTWIIIFLLGIAGVMGVFKTIISAKGSMGVGMILIIVGFIGIASVVVDNDTTGGLDKDVKTPYDYNAGAYRTSLSCSSPSIGTLNELNPKDQVITITSSNLNSANDTTMTFTLTTVRTDSIADNANNVPALGYTWDAFTFSNKDTPSDSATYYTAAYTATDKYTFTVDGVDYKVRAASDTLSRATSASAAVSIDVQDYTTLNKGIVNTYTEPLTIGRICTAMSGVPQACIRVDYVQV